MTVLPVGQNCFLGAALVRYGCAEPSLFKWANVSCRRVADWLETGAPIFSGPTAYRVAGSTYGTLDHRALTALLPSLPEEALVNTVAFDEDGVSYRHGVQLDKERFLASSPAQIERLNAEKIARLAGAFLDALKTGEATLLRLEFDDGVDVAAWRALIAAARAMAPCRFALIARQPPTLPPKTGDLAFKLESPLPPGSDVMNVTGAYAELETIFAALALARSGQSQAYIFDM